MPLQLQGNSGVTSEVEDSSTRAMRAVFKPYAYSTFGHYRVSLSILSVTAQAANARIAVLRNNAANLIVITRCTLRAFQVTAGTAQENGLDAYKLTGFTVLDTTNTVTPAVEVLRATGMAAAPGGAQLRTSNAAAGMTGGTSTKGSALIGSLPYNVAASVMTANPWTANIFDPENGEHPLVLAQNEGLLLENRTLNSTTYGIRWYVDLSWAEVATF